MYKVIFTQRALKDWKNLDKEIQDRIATKLKEYAKEPLKFARKLIHLKNSYGNNLIGIMVYVKSTTGISVEHAKSICYPFDYFFAISYESRHIPSVWDELIAVIEEFLRI